MLRILGMLALVVTGACREENPDWRGPADAGGGSNPSAGSDSVDPGSSDSGEPFTCDNPELTPCDFECIDISSNNDHCGGCGNRCVGNRECVDGECDR